MQIAIPLFDRFTALDAVGPHQVLSHIPEAEVIFLAERAGDVRDDSGSLILASAGLLAGREATTYWLALDELGRLGARPRPLYDAGSPVSAPPELVAAQRATSRF